jgi:methionyl-tRNA formyltransferase
MQPEKVRSGAFVEAMKGLGLEVGVVVAYGRILTREVLEGPKYGCINLHGSLLPRWRGAAPIQWSILEGDEETGVCLQQMVEALDAGDVLASESTRISREDTTQSLGERLAPMGARLLKETLGRWEERTPVPQDPGGVTLARILRKEDGRMDFGRTAWQLDCQVRGLQGWPGTWHPFQGQALKVLEARAVEGKGEAGTLLEGERVACGEGALELRKVQLPDRKPVSGKDFVNGSRLKIGDRIE